jgi:hypothetical protein
MGLVLGLLLEAMKPMGHHPLKEVDETQYKELPVAISTVS